MPKPVLRRSTVVVTDDVVERLTEALCGETMAIIRTLRVQDQQGYIDRMYQRTRDALEAVAGETDR